MFYNFIKVVVVWVGAVIGSVVTVMDDPHPSSGRGLRVWPRPPVLDDDGFDENGVLHVRTSPVKKSKKMALHLGLTKPSEPVIEDDIQNNEIENVRNAQQDLQFSDENEETLREERFDVLAAIVQESTERDKSPLVLQRSPTHKKLKKAAFADVLHVGRRSSKTTPFWCHEAHALPLEALHPSHMADLNRIDGLSTGGEQRRAANVKFANFLGRRSAAKSHTVVCGC